MMTLRGKNNQLELFEKDYSEFAKPILKWAGGKNQLIEDIDKVLPEKFRVGGYFTYIEPFVGSGALTFHLLKNYYSQIDKIVINDINPVLISIYKYIKEEPERLITELRTLKEGYYALSKEEDRKDFYLKKRSQFNSISSTTIEKAGLMIFLNKTCFNGLYRVNSKNEFNVPFGKYANPSIYDERVILANSKLLQKAIILNGDFEETYQYIGENTLFYFDPPYKPISQTASFKSYSSNNFEDSEQIRLKIFCDKITSGKNYFILSNSDVKNLSPDDNFFDDLYKNYCIRRVLAKRSINSDSTQRGQISELLITNENHFLKW